MRTRAPRVALVLVDVHYACGHTARLRFESLAHAERALERGLCPCLACGRVGLIDEEAPPGR